MEWHSYHRVTDIYQFLDYLASTFPQRFSVQSIGSSVQGKPLKVLKVSSGKPNSPAIWIDGGEATLEKNIKKFFFCWL